jgi:hypothetical protein
MTRLLLALALAALLLPAGVRANATFVIQARGSGFSDRTAVAPEGGNTALTLGEQRKAALQFAADLWGARLDSDVPITLEVVFQKFGCDTNSTVLAAAGAVSLFSGMDAVGADPGLWYPGALANRLAGKDLAPDEPDIQVIVNTSVDDECRDRFGGFYYGFDRNPGTRVDLVEVILHELAHGLGFSSWIDLDSGMPEESGMDVFTAHILDLAVNKTWRELTNDERRASALRVRGLAFQGAHTSKAVPSTLAKGLPSLSLDPRPSGFHGAVGDSGFSYADIEGPLRLAGSFEGCAAAAGDLTGAVVLIRPDCMGTELDSRLIAKGALGLLLALPASFVEPGLSLSSSGHKPALPTLTVSSGDADLLRQALNGGALRARLAWDTTRLVGADADGRPLLFASQPADPGSSVSHFEPLARPDLLMEPFIGVTPRHELDLTWPAMMDLGWAPFCGNQRLDRSEQCDEGEANSDVAPNACRTSCMRARCGDAVLDSGEACDSGSANSDSAANACRSTCSLARCGDAVVDSGEACDSGSANSDVAADACRTSCVLPRCGDGVVDRAEACDNGADNADDRADACRTDCRLARCGDGVRDQGESCDGEPDCSPSCKPLEHSEDPAWVDPWDAPRDEPSARKKASGCTLGSRARGASFADIGTLCCLLGLVVLRRRSPFAEARRARARP